MTVALRMLGAMAMRGRARILAVVRVEGVVADGAETFCLDDLNSVGESVCFDLVAGEGRGEGIVVDGKDVAVPEAGGGDRQDGGTASHVEDRLGTLVEGGECFEAACGGGVLARAEACAGLHPDDDAIARCVALREDDEGASSERRKGPGVFVKPVPFLEFGDGDADAKMRLNVTAGVFGLKTGGEEGLDAGAEDGETERIQFGEEIVGPVCLGEVGFELPGHQAGVTKDAITFLRPALSKAMSSFSPSAARTRP